MFHVLKHPQFAKLYLAQIVALLGTGLLTVALGLLAFDLAGAEAGRVLGTALTIKMVAYVGFSPIASALFQRFNRKTVMIAADLVRCGVAFSLPFITDVWQIYFLILILQMASATFTPIFQSVIPDILPQSKDYTNALSLSRLAYDTESLLSPILAGALLLVTQPSNLFIGTSFGFAASAVLVVLTFVPTVSKSRERPFWERVTRGSRNYLATPRLRGLLALNGVVSAIGAVVIVLSVVIAKAQYGGAGSDLAVLLGASGIGSMLVAFGLPRLLENISDRTVMLFGGACSTLLMVALSVLILTAGWPSWQILLVFWVLIGAGNAAIMTPSGRLLRRSAHAEDRPSIFTAQFALSHACWLFSYPAAGFLSVYIGVPGTMLILGSVAFGAMLVAINVWPKGTAHAVEHGHDDLPENHPHLADAVRRKGKWVHSHVFVIDDEHRVWPTSG